MFLIIYEEGDMDKPECFKFKVNNTHKLAFFNSIGKRFSFLLDYKTNTKITFGNDEKEYYISDMSPDGEFVATIQNTYEHKDRKLKIIRIKTQEIVFETNSFFIYEILFTPVPNLIICRADVKGRTKVFVFNFNTNEIIYKFPRQHPLEYGEVNFENNTFILPAIKRGQVVLFNFNTLEAMPLKIPTANIIQRVKQINSDHLFVIDSDFFAIKANFKNVLWKTKLDLWYLCYAPYFFIYENKAFFEYRFFFIDLDNGKIESIQPILEGKIGLIYKYFDDCVMDPFGTIFNLKTKEFSKFNIEEYLDKQMKG